MNPQKTQFTVAILGIGFLGACTLAAVIGATWFERGTDLTFALVTALTGVTSSAATYLFRLNGKNGGP